MSIFLFLVLIADGIFLVATQSQDQAWASQVCRVTGMCAHPVPFLILGIIFAGIYFVQR